MISIDLISSTILVSMKDSANLPQSIRMVIERVESRNLGLLSLVLHFLYRASTSTDGHVVLTVEDLRAVDKFLLKPEDVFPQLKTLFR